MNASSEPLLNTPLKFSYMEKRNYALNRLFSPPKRFVKKVVPYSPQDFFDLVIDVEKYQYFLPWCQRSSILKNADLGNNKFAAELTIGFKFIEEQYTSIITFSRPEFIQCTEWYFHPGPTVNSTFLEFSIDFHLANPIQQHTLGFFNDEIAESMTQSFEDRAAYLYGNKKQLSQLGKDCNEQVNDSGFSSIGNYPREENEGVSRAGRLDHNSEIQSESQDLSISDWTSFFRRIVELENINSLSRNEAIILKRLARKQNKELAIILLTFTHATNNQKEDINDTLLLDSLRELIADYMERIK